MKEAHQELQHRQGAAATGSNRVTYNPRNIIESANEQGDAQLSPFDIVKLARHPLRPMTSDYINLMFDDFIELHGDRNFGDDRAIITGFARLGRYRVMLIGQQKGKNTRERLQCNFGMPNPEGYRKALRKMKLAERLHLPIVTLIDTPGANPDIGAEERGQAYAIAENIYQMIGIKTPIINVVIGEGGSGGALGIGVGDKFAIMEYAYCSVISPEGCAAILWKDAGHAPIAAEALKLTAKDLHRLEIVDDIIAEPHGAAHTSPRGAADSLKKALTGYVKEIIDTPIDTLLDKRYGRYRRMGKYFEEAEAK